MRRFLAAAELLSVTITPVLHVWCESSCARDSGSSMPAACHPHHREAGAAASIADRHDCGSHETVPAIVARPSIVGAPRVIVGTFEPAISPSGPAARMIAAALRPPDSSPPPFVSPLRL